MSKHSPAQRINIIALMATIIIHGSIAAWALSNVSPILIKQQAIEVSIVAPSSITQEKSEAAKKEQVLKKDDGILKIKPQQKKNQADEPNKNTSNTKPTSGPQAIGATSTLAATSEPVFNAEYLDNPAPFYPQAARRKNTQGKVLLEVMVSRQGTAREVKIATSSGSNLLDDAAVKAVRIWKFIPAKQGEEIIEAKVIVPVEFKLN